MYLRSHLGHFANHQLSKNLYRHVCNCTVQNAPSLLLILFQVLTNELVDESIFPSSSEHQSWLMVVRETRVSPRTWQMMSLFWSSRVHHHRRRRAYKTKLASNVSNFSASSSNSMAVTITSC